MFYPQDEVFLSNAESIKSISRANTLEFCFFSHIVVIDILRNTASTVLSHQDSLTNKNRFCACLFTKTCEP